jgi:hypothetical protein
MSLFRSARRTLRGLSEACFIRLQNDPIAHSQIIVTLAAAQRFPAGFDAAVRLLVSALDQKKTSRSKIAMSAFHLRFVLRHQLA